MQVDSERQTRTLVHGVRCVRQIWGAYYSLSGDYYYYGATSKCLASLRLRMGDKGKRPRCCKNLGRQLLKMRSAMSLCRTSFHQFCHFRRSVQSLRTGSCQPSTKGAEHQTSIENDVDYNASNMKEPPSVVVVVMAK